MSTIGERIKQLRTDLNLNQTQFADLINKKQTTVAGYENNTKTVIERTLIDICRETKANYHWLATGEGEPFPEATDEDILAQLDVIMAGENEMHKNMIKALVTLSEEELEAIDKAIDKYIKIKEAD